MSQSKITWNQFRILNNNPTDAFQTLSKRYLSAEYNIDSSKLNDPETYPGVECEPFPCNNNFVSFQSKYNAKDSVLWSKFKESLVKTIEYKEANIFQIDIIYMFTNGPPPTPKKANTKETPKERLDNMAADAGIRLVWKFGCNITEKIEASSNWSFVKLKHFFISPSSQPKLYNPRINEKVQGYAKYHYSVSQLEYVHRLELEEQLTAFVMEEKKFSWCTLTGEAGIGKSRSILSFCEDLSEEWNWGWWTKGATFDFSNWEPDKPTLIVLDYVMGRLDEIGHLLDTLISCETLFNEPVRVLIAERLEEPWLQILLSRQTTGLKITNSSFNKNPEGKIIPIKIKVFSTVEKVELAKVIISNVPELKKSAEQLVKLTKEVDVLCRPLFMWLVAEKLVITECIPNLELLLREHIEKQRVKRWQQAEITEADELYSAVTTICGGIRLIPESFINEQSLQWFSKIDKLKHEIIVGRSSKDGLLFPFEPDILGELHALDVLQGATRLDSKTLNFALNIATGVDGGKGAIGFLFRAASDFPQHQIFSRLDQLQLAPYWYGIITQNLVLHLNQQGPNRDREAAWIIINALQNKLGNSSGNDLQYLEQTLAICGVNISYNSKEKHDFEKIQNLEQEVRLFAFKSKEENLLVYHSQMLNNLLRANRKELMTEVERVKITKDWLTEAKSINYPLAAKKSIVGLAQLKFVNAINAHSRKLDDADDPVSWYLILKDAVAFAADPEHSDIVYLNALKSSYENLVNNGHYNQARFYAEEFISYSEKNHKGENISFGSILFNEIQKRKNSGSGDINAKDLLIKLSKFDKYSQTLIQAI